MNSGFYLNYIFKYFKIDGKQLKIFSNLSLSLSDKEITVILGKSGCGKTTLLRILANLDTINGGSITYLKDGTPSKPKCSFVFQESRLMPWLNVKDNIAFSKALSEDEINFYLSMMNLENFSDVYPHQLSGGMAHRVSIARALAYNPDILLMDEPFAALDYFTRLQLQQEIIKIHQNCNKGIIFVTHNIDEALTLGKKILLLDPNKEKFEFLVDNPYPRDLTDSKFIHLKKEILNLLKS